MKIWGGRRGRGAAFSLHLFEKEGGRGMDVRVGDHILTKKPHPCGASEFAVLRVGMDFRIRCVKCGREVMVARSKIEKNIKKIVREALPL